MRRPLGRTGLSVSVLGLGCSRIASLRTRPSPGEILALLDRALEGGITVFDTADIYGQGDSERLIGRALRGRRERAVICTKAGLTLRASQTLVRLAKPVLRPLLGRLQALDRAAAESRARTEDTDFDPARLRRRLEGSLRRLRTDRVDLFLLHSPPLSALADGALYDLLDRLRDDGLARCCGVSCRSLDDAAAVISDARIACVQVPLNVETLAAARPVLAAAAGHGIGVIAREVFAGGALAALAAGRTPETLGHALQTVIAEPGVSTALIGTTARRHLEANLATVRSSQGSYGEAAGTPAAAAEC